jgi:hypothetical protein
MAAIRRAAEEAGGYLDCGMVPHEESNDPLAAADQSAALRIDPSDAQTDNNRCLALTALGL